MTWTYVRKATDETRYAMGAAALGITVAEYQQHVEAGERWCFRHRAWLPIATFGPHKRTASGLDTQCRECSRAYAREYQRQKRGYQGRKHALKALP